MLNLADILTMMRGWTLLIYRSEVKSQGQNEHTWKEPCDQLNRCVHLHQTWHAWYLWGEDEPYWLWRSKVKVIMDINGKSLWIQDWIFIKLGIHFNYNEVESYWIWMSEVKGRDYLQMWGCYALHCYCLFSHVSKVMAKVKVFSQTGQRYILDVPKFH